MRLIDADALKKDIMSYKTMPEIRKAICEVIDNATTVDTYSEEDMCDTTSNGFDIGYDFAKAKYERPQGDCEKCDFRRFTETFIDGVVDVMNKNGITSVEQLVEILKGDAERND